jgi:peptidoglycan/LPS O-acetylase OafA/YrhL
MSRTSAPLSNESPPILRFTGIDLFRGMAVFSVAILHAGNGSTASGLAGSLSHFSEFAVPFFLATSFFLASRKLCKFETFFSLQSRLSRLLIPYLSWSLIYLVFNILKYVVSKRLGEIGDIFRDPVSIIFFGGSAYHLYFIPLLLIGTVLLKGAEWLLRRGVSLKVLLLLFVVSITVYQILLTSGNEFKLGPNVAFQELFGSNKFAFWINPILRVSMVAFAWILRCLPYIFVSLILQHPRFPKLLPKLDFILVAFICTLFITVNGVGDQFLPGSLYEIMRGYLALMSAIALSSILNENLLIHNLGLCSFGIYLMHLIFVETFKTLLGRIYPEFLTEVTALTLLTLSSLAFTVSWILTTVSVKRKGALYKILFGI